MTVIEDQVSLELRYIVRGGAEPTEDGIRVRLPCAVLDLKLKDTRSGLFSSTIELPAGLSVTDGFPSNPVVADGRYRWELPLVPRSSRSGLPGERCF